MVLSKTTNMSEPNKEPILARTLPRIKRFVLPPSVPVENSNGYGTNATTRHNWMREENKNLTICYYKSRPKQKGFMRRMEILWQKKHLTATLVMKQLNNQRYIIRKKHLLSDLELKEFSQLAKLNGTVQLKLEDMSDSPGETSNVLVDKPPLSADNFPTDIQTLRQEIMDHLPSEQGHRSYLSKLRYEIHG